jgi:hypothetical protein
MFLSSHPAGCPHSTQIKPQIELLQLGIALENTFLSIQLKQAELDAESNEQQILTSGPCVFLSKARYAIALNHKQVNELLALLSDIQADLIVFSALSNPDADLRQRHEMTIRLLAEFSVFETLRRGLNPKNDALESVRTQASARQTDADRL